MARPHMDSRVEGRRAQSCRMVVPHRDVRPSGSTQSVSQATQSQSQARSRRRAAATPTTPTSAAPVPFIPAADALSTSAVPQQYDGLRNSTGAGHERSCFGGRLQPLPDVLPERHADPVEERPTPEEQAVARVAIQLRTIGDEMNAVYLQRRNEGAQWQNWRGVYRGLVAFLADTISTLYQHGLR